MGVLSIGGTEPDGSGELQAVLEELRALYEGNSALKLEIGHLKEELHECTEGQLCQSVAGAFFFFTTRSRISDRRALHPSTPLSSESGRGGRLSLERDSSEGSERFTRQFLGLRMETVALVPVTYLDLDGNPNPERISMFLLFGAFCFMITVFVQFPLLALSILFAFYPSSWS